MNPSGGEQDVGDDADDCYGPGDSVVVGQHQSFVGGNDTFFEGSDFAF